MGVETKTIREFMIPLEDYPAINHNETLEKAVDLMYEMSQKKGYRWLIVIDDNDNLMGFLTLRNVFEAINMLVPKEGGWMSISTKVSIIKEIPLKKCIKPLVNVSVLETDPPTKAAELILNRRITIIPVINQQRTVVGIIRPVDLLPFIRKLFKNIPD